MSHDKIKGNLLLDHYGSLLTEHQQEILNDYYLDDLSMQEIAEIHGISKSAVSDIIKRSYEQLKEYEDKLSLIGNSEKLDRLITQMDNDQSVNKKYVKELRKINRG